MLPESKINCCGCGACAQICPKNCIEMKEDREGFAYPVIDQTRCIGCGLCEKTCPMLHQTKRSDEVAVYGAASKDIQLLKRSSSGGVFGLLADYVLKAGGAVFGCAFNDNLEPKHSMAENEEDVKKFHGSKYVQSDAGNTYAECKMLLQQGKSVLYSGTPCQIAGLKQYLEKEYDKLICVEIICHGVPSPGLWKQYVKELEAVKGKRIVKVAFRYQDQGWKKYRFFTQYEDGTMEVIPGSESSFVWAFLNKLTLRPSCYDCKFRLDYSKADLIIGDFWGVGRYHQKFNEENGVSVVLILGPRGKQIWGDISNNTDFVKAELSQVIPANGCLQLSVFPNRNRMKLMELYAAGQPIEQALRQYAVNYEWGQSKYRFGVWGSYNLRLVSQFLINGSAQRRAFHFSNSSIVSIMAKPKEVTGDIAIENPYRREALLADWSKQFRIQFDTIAESADYILIDLLEERFDILLSGETYITGSDAYEDLICIIDAEKADAELLFESNIYKKAMKQFVELLLSKFSKKQIILVKTYLCERYFDGTEYKEFEDAGHIRQINRKLEKLYYLFEYYCPDVFCIDNSEELRYAMYNHRYGCFSHHVNYDACFELADKIYNIVKSNEANMIR